MTIRSNPTPPYNEAELKLIKERQTQVQALVSHNLRNCPCLWSPLVQSTFAYRHQLSIARFAMQADGKFCLLLDTWRAIAHELSIPPEVYFIQHDGANRVGFIETIPSDTGAWVFKPSRLFSNPGTSINDQDVMTWIFGIDKTIHSYKGHHNALIAPPDIAEKLGDKAVEWDRTDVTGWQAQNENKFDAATTWWPVMIGAAYWFATAPEAPDPIPEGETFTPRTLVVGSDTLSAEKAAKYLFEALEAWTSPQAFFDAVQPIVLTKLQARQLLSVNPSGSAKRTAMPVNEARWTEWRFTSYQAALAAGRSLTGY